MNIANILSKKCAGTLIAAALMLSLCGCSNNTGVSDSLGTAEFGNLDLSEAIISENVPTVGEWYTFRLKSSVRSPSTASCMEKAAEALEIPNFDRDRIIYQIYGDAYPDEFEVSEREMTRDYYKSLFIAYYTTDDIHIDILNNGRTVYNNRRLIRETVSNPQLLDYDSVIKAGWMPSNSSEYVKSYDISDTDGMNDKYALNGKEISVREGIDIAIDFINRSRSLNEYSKRITFEPSEVSVRRQTDTNYGFYFKFRSLLDGVPMDNTNSGTLEGWGTTLFPIYDYLYFNDVSSAAYFSASSVCADEFISAEKTEINYDIKGACAVVSKELSREHKFKIVSAELIYCADSIEDPETKQMEHVIKPMWQFIITNTGMQFGTICVNVDAKSGEMFMRAVQ